tara:strand:- start:313 stop:636 length:324 start_codon:yes stop_codon:yes gene_type:complete
MENDSVYLENLKQKIESLNKGQQIEILKIFLENETKLNENKSGIFINMSFLKQDVLEKLDKYLEYIKDQEHNLNNLETQKQEFKETYFNMKGNKDNVSLTNSYGTHI